MQFQIYIKAQNSCNIVLALWIKSRKNVILHNSILIVYQTRAKHFFKHDCMNSKDIYHINNNLTISKKLSMFVPKIMQYVISLHHTPCIFKSYVSLPNFLWNYATEKQIAIPYFCSNILWLWTKLKYFSNKFLFCIIFNKKKFDSSSSINGISNFFWN